MPELPEVETTRRGLLKAIKNLQITRVVVRRHDLRFPIPKRLAKALEGAKILGVRRRAKYLLIDLDTGETVLAHLGMSGSFTVRPQGYRPQTHDHVVMYLEEASPRARPGVSRNKARSKPEEIPAQGRDDALIVVFNDPRRFGVLDLVRTGHEAQHKLLKNLGPEPFSEEFSATYLKTRLLKRKGAIKPVLMDQKLVVGVGNIYASEALYSCGIHPDTPACEAAVQSKKIIAAIRATLQAAIDSGGSTLRDYTNAQNEAGYFQHQFRVYDRVDEPCFSCGAYIESGTRAGRATYWCPKCQRKPGTRRKC